MVFCHWIKLEFLNSNFVNVNINFGLHRRGIELEYEFSVLKAEAIVEVVEIFYENRTEIAHRIETHF